MIGAAILPSLSTSLQGQGQDEVAYCSHGDTIAASRAAFWEESEALAVHVDPYQRLVANIALRTVRDPVQPYAVIQLNLPATFLLRHFGETPDMSDASPVHQDRSLA